MKDRTYWTNRPIGHRIRGHARRVGPSDGHHGFVLVGVLVGLLVIALMAASLVRAVMAHQRHSRVVEQKLQAFWLAESAADKARAALRRSTDYRGETWNVSAAMIGGDTGATIQIQVDPDDPMADQRQIKIVAYYPADLPRRIGYRKQVTVSLDRPSELP